MPSFCLALWGVPQGKQPWWKAFPLILFCSCRSSRWLSGFWEFFLSLDAAGTFLVLPMFLCHCCHYVLVALNPHQCLRETLYTWLFAKWTHNLLFCLTWFSGRGLQCWVSGHIKYETTNASLPTLWLTPGTLYSSKMILPWGHETFWTGPMIRMFICIRMTSLRWARWLCMLGFFAASLVPWAVLIWADYE